jgi:hypothetical protein
MRSGDCAGALDAFDAALRTTNDATIHRDRGICHEELGDPFPAIDDYRIYLGAAPEAPDADDIRQRLARLEKKALGYSSESTDTPDQTPVSGPTEQGPVRDTLESTEHDRDEASSPLRKGKGLSLAPLFALHKWVWSQENSFGDTRTWSESVGLALRWSTGDTSALFAEVGYEHFNDTAIAKIQGFTSFLGYEARFALDTRASNQLFLAPGVGYEFVSSSPADVGATSVSGGLIVPRLRFGWRHMLARSAALDLSLDGGVGLQALSQGTPFFFASGNASAVELIAANVAVQWGL